MPLCTGRDDVVEEGTNVWYGEESCSFKPKYDIVLVHGLGSHPYWAWHHEPSPRVNRHSTSPSVYDSTVSIFPSSSRFSRFLPVPDDQSEHYALVSSPDMSWTNEYSSTDFFGRIGTFWPRDLLPIDCPDARILTVGYKSQWTSSKFQTSFKECGEHLLNILQQARNSENAEQRPIIFVAHSFGGLVVQSALVSARVDERFSSIRRSVAGCLFLGCPFQGTHAIALLSMATTINSNQQQILDSLQPGNRDLWMLQDDFLKAYNTYRQLPMVCFYEKLRSGLGRTMMVVPENAACLAGVKSVGLQKDHRTMNKFKSHSDESYALFVSELKAMMKSVSRIKHSDRGKTQWRYSGGEQLKSQVQRLRKPKRESMKAESQANILHQESSIPAAFGLSDQLFETEEQRKGQRDYFRKESVNATPWNVRNHQPMLDSPIMPLSLRNVHHSASLQLAPTQQSGRTNSNLARENQIVGNSSFMPHNTSAVNARDGYNIPLNLPEHLKRSYGILQSQAQLKGLHREEDMKLTSLSNTANLSGMYSGLQIIELDATDDFSKSREIHGAFNADSMPPESLKSVGTTVRKQGLELDTGNDSRSTPTPATTYDRSNGLRYVHHIEQDLAHLSESAVYASRKNIFDKLTPKDADLMPNSRVVLTGPVGIGKSYIAMGCVKRLLQRSASTPIFWFVAESEGQLEEDCKAVTDLMSLKRPQSSTSAWDWLCKILRRLADTIIGPWLVVLDGVREQTRIQKLCSMNEGEHGFVMMTTRNVVAAEAFITERGIRLDVGPFDPCYAATLLSFNEPVSGSSKYDEAAQAFGYDPFAVTRAKTFLTLTKQPIIDYVTRLSLIFDEKSWSKDGQAILAGWFVAPNRHLHVNPYTTSQSKQLPLVPVLRSFTNPCWFVLFDELNEEQPAACELLSVISVIGRSHVPRWFLSTSVAITSATNLLLDQSFLASRSAHLEASPPMLIVHKVWLASRSGLRYAYAAALKMVSCEYPDASLEANWHLCESLEPFAKAVMSYTAESWIEMDDTNRWLRTMLLQKRSKYLNLSGTSVFESQEMEEAEVTEIRAIHGIQRNSSHVVPRPD